MELPKGAIVRLANRSADTVQWYDCAPTTSTITGPLVYEGWNTNTAGPFLVDYHKHDCDLLGMTSVVCSLFVVMFSAFVAAAGMPEGQEMGFLTSPVFWITSLCGCATVAIITMRKVER